MAQFLEVESDAAVGAGIFNLSFVKEWSLSHNGVESSGCGTWLKCCSVRMAQV